MTQPAESEAGGHPPITTNGQPEATRSPRSGPWQIERIETEPMTGDEYQRAVTALAVLIRQWQRQQQ